MKELYIATANEEKLKEAMDILEVPLKLAKIEIDEIQSKDVTKIAHEKAKAAFEKVGKPVIVDDVSLSIDALNGMPGPYVKDFLEVLGNQGLLRLLKDKQNRNLHVITTIGYHDGVQIYTFAGVLKGILSTEERGKDGWGFDPIIIPEGQTQTLAELGSEIKNKISHRRRAFDLLKHHLDSQK